MTLQKLLREPLLHFLLLGALLFALYGWVNRDALQSTDEIVVDRSQVQALRTQFERVWQREPTQAELKGLIDNWVREEIIYREGVAAGMERGDEVVRRRVVQKMEFLTESMATGSPTEQELQQWLQQHPDDYRIAPRYTLQQVYFDPGRHRDATQSVVTRALAELRRNPEAVVGDSTLLPARLDNADAAEIAKGFGERFAEQLQGLPEGQWQGPLISGFGVHLVRIQERSAARTPALAEVRAAVERDLLNARSGEASEVFYQNLRKRYTVTVEAPAAGTAGAGSVPQAGKQ